MDEFRPEDIEDAHLVLPFFEFSFVVVFIFSFFHSCGDIDRAHMQESFHGLIGPFGYLGS